MNEAKKEAAPLPVRLERRVMPYLPEPSSKIRFDRDWAMYTWSVSVGRYHSPSLPMRGGSVWEKADGHAACWRWLGAA